MSKFCRILLQSTPVHDFQWFPLFTGERFGSFSFNADYHAGLSASELDVQRVDVDTCCHARRVSTGLLDHRRNHDGQSDVGETL